MTEVTDEFEICQDCGYKKDVNKPSTKNDEEPKETVKVEFEKDDIDPHAKFSCHRCEEKFCNHLKASIIYKDDNNKEHEAEWCARCYGMGKISETIFNINQGQLNIHRILNTLDLANGLIAKCCYVDKPRNL